MADPIQVVCVHCDAVNRLPPERDARAGKCGRCGQPLVGSPGTELEFAL